MLPVPLVVDGSERKRRSESKEEEEMLLGKALTLSNPDVAAIMFPDEQDVMSFDKVDAEERIDDYVLLHNLCASSTDIGVHAVDSPGRIGFKVRGGEYASLELKTVVVAIPPSPHPPSSHDEEGGVANPTRAYDQWIKSRRRGRFDVSNDTVLIDFLNDVARASVEQRVYAEEVARWIRQKQNQKRDQKKGIPSHGGDEERWQQRTRTLDPVRIVRCHKRRRFSTAANGTVSVQEADVVFELLAEGQVDGKMGGQSHRGAGDASSLSNSGGRTISLRSWSAEAVEDSEMVRSLAKRWDDAFPRAAEAAGVLHGREGEVEFWARSYPEMILQVPRLLHRGCDTVLS